ncbi:MAG: phytanoyl-CoA dioxygenase [Rhodospirillaceae bacterium]|nr:phytanoyl-CoA dioxygenase [Rhodospirillaceae bacterium]
MDKSILSLTEIEAYRRDGVIIPRFRLPEDALCRLRSLTDRLIADNPHLGDEPMACPHVPGSGIQNLNCDEGWLEFPTFPAIVDMLEQLIGPDIILWGTTLFHKPATKGRVVPWHRDGRYWPIKPLETTSVWIAIDECTAENGCLRAIPGSHKAREVGRHFRSTSDEVAIPETLYDSEYDESLAVNLVLQPGQMAVFDVFTVHGSTANPSGRRRTGLAMRYIPATCHYDHHDLPVSDSRGAAHHTRPLIQVRGTDRCGRNDFMIGHPDVMLGNHYD